MGNTAAEYTSKVLPAAIQKTLGRYIQGIGGRLDRRNIVACESQVTALLKNEIVMFEKHLADGVRDVCPHPEQLTEEQARHLIKEHRDILERAFSGTTMAAALINVDEHFMWAVGVGDSSVGEYA